ncbi:ABC transporter substrate-binding protein [Paenibacillus thalictri]|uniref:Extracellular solute-binding protein n=1 Tax=Paenibacillus thalictri TaxID=2527873 RepID=A0A4Q9DWT6_9BACL|nr:extracellular solute-binding protein [Paenibacillus thalictri]TBL80825.1 extracellular solute-binding protein [Paenibacillus thalictri]
MKARQKMGSVALLCLSVLLAATGCSGGSGQGKEANRSSATGGKEPVKLKIWGGTPEENGPAKAVENWNKAHPDVQAEYVRFVNDSAGNTKLDTALYSGKDVDIFIGYDPNLRNKRIEAGVVEPLDPFLAKDAFNLDELFGKGNTEVINGKIYYVPAQKAIDGILINKTALDEIGEPLPPVDWTWEDVANLAKKLTKGEGANKRYGFLFDYAKASFGNTLALSQQGADFLYHADGTSAFDDPIWKQIFALQERMEKIDKSIMPYGDVVASKPAPDQEFLKGKAAMIWGAFLIRSVKDLEKYPHNFVTAVLPTPHMTQGQPGYNGFGMQDFLAISTNSQHKQEAWEFIKWYSTDGYEPMVPFGRVPSWKKFDVNTVVEATAGKNKELFDLPSLKAYYSGDYRFTFPKNNTARPELGTLLKEETEKFILNNQSMDITLANLKKRADELIKAARK